MKPAAMYALERRVSRKNQLCRCWTRYGISGNRSLLERVKAAQPRQADCRIVVT